MGDCVVEDGHPRPKEVEAALPVADAEGAGEPREGGGGKPKKAGGIRREPSFSRWCKDPSAAASNAPGAAAASDGDDSEEFELPLLPSAPGGGGGSMPMDIEAGAAVRSDGLPISPWLVAKIMALIASWYTLSTCLTLYNKEMLGKHMWKFPAPFLMNTVHFTMQAVASRVIVWFQNRGLEGGASKMSWKDYGLRVVPTALATALDINLSNISLVFITVTFATMCKSAAPIFILLFAFLFRLEKPSFSLLGIMLIVSFGVLLTVARETEFNLWGFTFIMLAAIMSGFRWSMTQILLQKEEYGLKNPFTLMSYVTPVMAIVTAILSIAMDPWNDFRANHFFDSSAHIIRSSLLLLLGGALAFFMVLTEYVLVSVTSAVTVTIAGIVKEAVTILVAVLFFNDPFTWLKGLGLAIIIFGVSLFNVYKYKRFKKGHHSENGETNIQSSNGTSKYVILDDDTEDQDATG
ncbi:probable sugar phosphate/phosphate translocator At1g06470 [Phragmites australis]|uniref:probable sugar phosphate/phosphate translocator At1g06470 n=1 Tax=Phragmites australis TaxID=29695 RepID=UPI002D7A06D2|nr:probable sugar phosphate/phosphate translocator At1g06470 [Phragmites australis]